MFRRLVFDDSAALFTIVAFVTAFSIYATFAWRALRMKRSQIARFENLPFETPTPENAAAQTRCALPDPNGKGRSRPAPQQS